MISARTRLEDRIRDTQFDKLVINFKRLNTILHLHDHMTHRRRGPFVSIQIMSRWRNLLGINVGIGAFLRKYSHIFEIFTQPVRRNLCCRMTQKMLGLIKEEERSTKQWESEAVYRVKRLLKMSLNGTLHVHALRMVRRELGLPDDFRDSIICKYSNELKLVDLEVVELVDKDMNLEVAEIEKWREKEFIEKWLSEFETKYAFPINLPTGYRIERGFRDKLKNWQRLPYIKPYEKREVLRVRTCGGIERYEKRAVGILHEFLSLTVGKMVEVDKLAHFRRDFAIQVNMRELFLKHPGIFYISTKGNTQTVFLREAYSKGSLLASNPIYKVRRKMLDLILLGNRNTKELHVPKNTELFTQNVCRVNVDSKGDGDWVIPLLENLNGENSIDRSSDIVVSSVEQFDDKLLKPDSGSLM